MNGWCQKGNKSFCCLQMSAESIEKSLQNLIILATHIPFSTQICVKLLPLSIYDFITVTVIFYYFICHFYNSDLILMISARIFSRCLSSFIFILALRRTRLVSCHMYLKCLMINCANVSIKFEDDKWKRVRCKCERLKPIFPMRKMDSSADMIVNCEHEHWNYVGDRLRLGKNQYEFGSMKKWEKCGEVRRQQQQISVENWVDLWDKIYMIFEWKLCRFSYQFMVKIWKNFILK